jgi:trans-aconitate methyltransferase
VVDAAERIAGPSPRAVLDFGCGDGLLLDVAPEHWTIDAYDTDPAAREAAQDRFSRSSRRTTVYSDIVDIPENHYDVILAISVFQYLRSEFDLLQTLTRLKSWLAVGSDSFALITDLPLHRRPVRDAFDLARFVAAAGIRTGRVAALTGQVHRPYHASLDATEEVVARVASEAGFSARHVAGISPLTSRSHFLLR